MPAHVNLGSWSEGEVGALAGTIMLLESGGAAYACRGHAQTTMHDPLVGRGFGTREAFVVPVHAFASTFQQELRPQRRAAAELPPQQHLWSPLQ